VLADHLYPPIKTAPGAKTETTLHQRQAHCGQNRKAQRLLDFGEMRIMAALSSLAVLSGALKITDKLTLAALSSLAVLSGALKITDKLTLAMEAVGNKIRLNCQGWEDIKVLGERQVLMVVAIKGQLYLLPEARPSRFERVDHDGVNEAGYGPDDFKSAMTLQSAPLPRRGRARKPSAGPTQAALTRVSQAHNCVVSW
jgi:hypothetical protein